MTTPRQRWALACILWAVFLVVVVFAITGCTARLPIGQDGRYGSKPPAAPLETIPLADK